MNKEEILKALEELKKLDERKFKQTVELIINLKNFDVKRESINIFVSVPHKFRDVKAAAFLNNKSTVIDTITKAEFDRYKGKEGKKLAKKYDLFFAHGSLMPLIATHFGRILGPLGKMPSPQMGLLMKEDEASIKELVDRANKSLRVKTKEPSIKLAVAKEDMKLEDIEENFMAVYNAIFNALPKKKENIKSVMIKLTMTKPIKLSF